MAVSATHLLKCLADLNGAVAAWVLGLLVSADLPEIAITALSGGLDNSALRELAGLSSPAMVEANVLLKRGLEEKGRQIPDKRSAALQYASSVSQLIVTNQVTPLEGAQAIFRASIAVGDDSFHDLD